MSAGTPEPPSYLGEVVSWCRCPGNCGCGARISDEALVSMSSQLAAVSAAEGWDMPATLFYLLAQDDNDELEGDINEALARGPDHPERPQAAAGATWLLAVAATEPGLDAILELAGSCAPPGAVGVALVCELWALPEHELGPLDRLLPPNEHPRRQELRLVVVVLRDRRCVLIEQVRDRSPMFFIQPTRRSAGVLASLSRVLALDPLPHDYPYDVGAYLARRWLMRAVEAAESAPCGEGGARVWFAGLSSSAERARAGADAEAPRAALLPISVCAELSRELTWEALMASESARSLAGVGEAMAWWMGPALFSRALMAVLPQCEDLVETLAVLTSPELADRAREQLRLRGWWEPDEPCT